MGTTPETQTSTKSNVLLDVSIIERKLKHNRRRLIEKQQEQAVIGSDNLNYHSGRAIGYLEGKVAVLEDILGS